MRESVHVQDRGLCDKYWPIISFLECQIIISNSFCNVGIHDRGRTRLCQSKYLPPYKVR